MKEKSYVVILHNIRSTHNVGSMFRTSDALGISHVYLSGYTPSPIDQYGRARKDISKASLGAEVYLPWTSVTSLSELISELKKKEFTIVAIEQSEKSVDYKKIKATDKIAFIMGNEVEGIEKEVLDSVDVIAEIPMNGKKESLNVSVAFGVALFRILDK